MGREVWPRFRHLSLRLGFNMAGVSCSRRGEARRRRGGRDGRVGGTQVGVIKKTKKTNKRRGREIQHACEQKNLDVSGCEERLPRVPGSVDLTGRRFARYMYCINTRACAAAAATRA